MAKKIVVNAEQMKALQKVFKVTDRCIYYALTFKRNSIQSMKIRQCAINMGAEVWHTEKSI